MLDDVSWRFYEQLLSELAQSRRRLRVSFDDGRLELMERTNRHEQARVLIRRLAEAYALEADVPTIGVGSVTLKRSDLAAGLEPDDCYYVRTPAPPATAVRLDLGKYQPPDLAIEIHLCDESMDRARIYAAIGVPEVWRFDGEEVAVLHRQRGGRYKRAMKSLAFPKLSIADLNRFIAMSPPLSQHAAVRAFRDWLRDGK